MKGVWTATGIIYVITGSLEGAMFLLSIMGVIVGGVMTFADLPGADPEQEAMAPLILGLYTLWLVVTAIGTVVHLWGGIEILRGRTQRRGLLWAGVVVGFLDVLTCYCAVPGIVASVLGLVALTSPDRDGAAGPRAGRDPAFNPDPGRPGDVFEPPRDD